MGRNRRDSQPLDRVGPATSYPNQAGAYADGDQADDGNDRHCLDARSNWAEGAATYGRQTRTNVSYRHGSIRS